MAAENLSRLQKRFWEFIIAPNGVQKAIPEMKERDPDGVPLRNWIEAPSEENAIRRLDIYANSYFQRLYDVLKEYLEYVCKLMGEQAFYRLITGYLWAHPSANSSLYYLGDALVEYVEAHPVEGQPPWLADFIRFEEQLHQVVLAPDSEGDPLTIEQMKEIPPEQWGMLGFRLVPSLRIVELEYPIDKAWVPMLQQQPIPTLSPEKTRYAFWRNQFASNFERLDVLGEDAFDMILDGQPFGYACLAFLPDDADLEQLDPAALQESVQQAHQALSIWLRRGMLASYFPFEVSEDEPPEPTA